MLLLASALANPADTLSPTDVLWSGSPDEGIVLAAGLDADGDGLQDVVVGLPDEQKVLVWSGGSYTVVVGGKDFGSAVALADLDGDGDGELVVLEEDALVVLDNGTEITRFEGDFQDTLRVADLDGDGDDDILALEDDELVFIDGGDLSLKTLGVDGEDLVAAIDLDQDGHLEAATLSSEGLVVLQHGTVMGVEAETMVDTGQVVLVGPELRRVRSDLTAAPANNPLNIDDQGRTLAVPGDLNDDGFNEVLIAGTDSVALAWGRSGGITGQRTVLDATAPGLGDALHAADLDGDGFVELLVGSEEGVFVFDSQDAWLDEDNGDDNGENEDTGFEDTDAPWDTDVVDEFDTGWEPGSESDVDGSGLPAGVTPMGYSGGCSVGGGLFGAGWLLALTVLPVRRRRRQG